MAGSAMVAVGCTQVTGGDPVVNEKDAPAFRTSMSVSVSQSAVTSSLRESQRLESLTAAAVQDSCAAFVPTSDASVDAVNAYVDAFNSGGPSAAAAAEQPAVDALNGSADQVEATVNPTLPDDVAQAMTAWVDSARAAARAIAERQPPDQFNSAIAEPESSPRRRPLAVWRGIATRPPVLGRGAVACNDNDRTRPARTEGGPDGGRGR